MIIFRIPSVEEMNIFQRELDYWYDKEAVSEILHSYSFIVGEGNWQELFIVNKKTAEVYKTHPQLSPYSVGITIGEFKGINLFFTLGGITILLKNSRKQVAISDEAEQLFLYSRDLLGKSILRINEEIKKEDKIIIVNRKGDILGMGKLLVDLNLIKSSQYKDETVIKNLIDLGWYLRKGM